MLGFSSGGDGGLHEVAERLPRFTQTRKGSPSSPHESGDDAPGLVQVNELAPVPVEGLNRTLDEAGIACWGDGIDERIGKRPRARGPNVGHDE